jgi:hypothetical protein
LENLQILPIIYLKYSLLINENFRTTGVSQVVELLLCKHEALGSNPTPIKNKKIKILFVLMQKYFALNMVCFM